MLQDHLLWNLKAKTENLIGCIRKCIGKSPDEQYSIIEEKYADTKSYAEKIRKDLGYEENTQADSDEAYKVLEDYLIEIGAIDVAKIIEKKELSPLEGSAPKEGISNQSSIIIPAEKGETLDLTNSINNYFCVDREGSTDEGRKFKESVTIPEKPPAITIEINNKAILDNIPLNLKYEDDKFAVDDRGEFEFNYASIHEGSRDGGHYFSIYKENGAYYIYDNTKIPSDRKSVV